MTQRQITKIENSEADFIGEVLTPGGPAHDVGRRAWNAMIDRRPAPDNLFRVNQNIRTA